MNETSTTLERTFERLLRQHLEQNSEESLQAAYEAGREALERGEGVLDTFGALVRAGATLADREGSGPPSPIRERFVAFAFEALSPFEMAHRGARDANQALRRLDEVREEELRRVARELHDASGQVFASVHLALADLSQRVDSEAFDEVERVRALLVRAEEQLRRLAHEFRPGMLDDLGLRPALEQLARYVSLRGGLEVRITGELPDRLPPAVETALYRATQEALHNARRHAGASAVTVSLRSTGDSVRCVIEDDGRGFEVPPPGARSAVEGLGLRGIRERLATFRGTLEVDSAPGQGTRLVLDIPTEAVHASTSAARR